MSIPLYGSCYLYDDLKEGDCSRDESDTSIGSIGGQGIFRWSGGKSFVEHPVTSKDFVFANLVPITQLDFARDMDLEQIGPVMSRLNVVISY